MSLYNGRGLLGFRSPKSLHTQIFTQKVRHKSCVVAGDQWGGPDLYLAPWISQSSGWGDLWGKTRTLRSGSGRCIAQGTNWGPDVGSLYRRIGISVAVIKSQPPWIWSTYPWWLCELNHHGYCTRDAYKKLTATDMSPWNFSEIVYIVFICISLDYLPQIILYVNN